MPRGVKQEREIFECPSCKVRQPLSNAAHHSITCVGCSTAFAIVRTPDGEKALVEYFNQGNSRTSADSEVEKDSNEWSETAAARN